MKKPNKALIFLMVLMILIMPTIIDVQEAQAFIPLLGLAPEVVSVCAGLLTVAGYQFLTDDAVKAAGYELYNNMSANLKLVVATGAALGGRLVVTSGLWQYVQNFCNEDSINDATIEYAIAGETSTYTNPTATPVYTQMGISHGGVDFVFTGLDGQHMTGIQLPYNGAGAGTKGFGSLSAYRTYAAGVYTTHVNYTPFGGTAVEIGTQTGNTYDPEVLVHIYSDGLNWFTMVNAVVVSEGTGDMDMGLPYPRCLRTQYVGNYSVTPIGYDELQMELGTTHNKDLKYYGNPANDYSNHDITLPTNPADVTGKTHDQVLTDNGVAVEVPGTDTNTGLLSSILTGVNTIANSVSTTLTNVYNAVLAIPTAIATAISTVFTPTYDVATAYEGVEAKFKLKMGDAPDTLTIVDYLKDGTAPKIYMTNFITGASVLMIDFADYADLFQHIRTWCGGICYAVTAVWVIRTFKPEQTID